MFSDRVPDLRPNRLAEALARMRREGRPFIDLTVSNPTIVGLEVPRALLAPLAEPRGLSYHPAPLGLATARATVAALYRAEAFEVPPERVVLTASTSEAYGHLFKLLCNPDDEVLVPRPSYPLFDHLTRLEGIRPVPYDLEYFGTWSIDLEALRAAWRPRVRAVLVVQPNNPTGSYLTRRELETLADLCHQRDAVLIVDEVFGDYPLSDTAPPPGLLLGRTEGLCVSLGGLSKAVGLPQLKVAWMVLSGANARVAAALDRLEWINDAYLSVSTPSQLALPALLAAGAGIRTAIHERLRANLRRLEAALAAAPASRLLRPDGGWSGVVQIPAIGCEEGLVLDLLERDGVLVHPGYFFDFPREAFLVFSLLPEGPRFAEGIGRVFARLSSDAGTIGPLG